nr:hypothetical protein [Mucilaginibacter humi]
MDNIDDAVAAIVADGVIVEPIRIDEFTGKRFTFLLIRMDCLLNFTRSKLNPNYHFEA